MVAKKRFEIRFPKAAETEKIQAFFRNEWGKNHIFAHDRVLLEWQFANARTPFLDSDGIAALTAWDGDVLAGMQGLVYSGFRQRGSVMPAVWLCNLMTPPHYRTQGVGLRLMTAVHKLPIKVIATSGINPSLLPVYEKLRYSTIANLPRFVRIIDHEVFASLSGSRPDPRSLSAQCESGIRDEIHPISRFDASWETFFDHIAGEWYVGTDRSAAFMNWRYLDHPTFDYKVDALLRVGEINGLMVYRVERIAGRKQTVTRLIELWAKNCSAASSLLIHLDRRAEANGAAMIDHYNSQLQYRETFEAHGWLDTRALDFPVPSLFQPFDQLPRPTAVAVRFLTDSRPPTADMYAGLCVLKSDGDQDRPNLPRGVLATTHKD